MRGLVSAHALALLFIATEATAQTSTCMAMGGGMVHCDHLGGGWTDCNAVGSMATCQTMGVPNEGQAQSSDDGAALGKGIGSLISSIRERSFRKKVGGMLAAGDCEGAAKYAFEKGRLELGSEIQRSCRSSAYSTATPRPVASTIPLPQALQQIANRAPTPTDVDPNTTVTNVQADGSQLTFNVVVKDKALFNDQWRGNWVRQICDPAGFGRMMQQGATVRTNFENQSHRALGVMTVTSGQCG